METYLKLSKTISAVASSVHAVLGSPACDLDSAVCALVYGLFKYSRQDSDVNKSNVRIVPVLNIKRAEFALRTDVRHVLSRCGINDISLLTFRDDVCLHSLHAEHRLQLTLVDCHVLTQNDTSLDSAVIEVFDHRPRARPDREGILTTIELVGSCSTLIAEKLLKESFTLPTQAAEMLYSAIVLDTACFSKSAGRTTPKDVAVISDLQNLLPTLDRQKVFDELLQIKQNDTQNLGTCDMLRKDVKVVSLDDFVISVSAIVSDMQTFLSRPKLISDLESYAQEQSALALVLMFMQVVPQTDTIRRELAVYSTHSQLRQQICQVLCVCKDPLLSLESVQLPDELSYVTAFNQINVKASRKAVLPIIQNNIDVIKSSFA